MSKLGYTYKKVTGGHRTALRERKNAPLILVRHYVEAMQAHPDRLVFIDETSVKTNLTRQYGGSLCESRLEMNAPFGAWRTQTLIAGLSHDNLIIPWIIKGAMYGEAFAAYVRNVLAHELRPGTVVTCDNLATHYD